MLLRDIYTMGVLLLIIGMNTIPNISCKNIQNSPHKVDNTLNKNIIHNQKHVPDCVKLGDLLLFDVGYDESNRWKRPGPYNEHGVIYIGRNTTSNEDKFVEFMGNVRHRNYTQIYNQQKNLIFLRVKTADSNQIQAAVKWANSKINLQYQIFFQFPFGLKIANTDLLFPTANKLYCMELLWAAYYQQGIDIDQNGWCFPWWVTGNDILTDNDIEVIYQEINDSTEFIKPYKGIHIANNKILSLINAMNRSYIFGDIDLEVISYNDRIQRVDFYVNGIYLGNDTKPNIVLTPYSWSWKESEPGKYVIKADALDDRGNEYFSRITVWKFC